eukprot:CAMPEP_0170604756 /NCGR_PEP_ID=MMETSP0224-20130122/19600_1 /TAXON_ID=285029 /ORGANISM="Togula jolla, Strain CCCM 725" /LENGTH=102 /DNA_ID=CAMNT_0010929695 /DNA_START=179 /DNA_END=487 /DNA_ORIENTATION=-
MNFLAVSPYQALGRFYGTVNGRRNVLHELDMLEGEISWLAHGDVPLDCNNEPLLLASLEVSSNPKSPHVQQVQKMRPVSSLVGQDAGKVLSGSDAHTHVLLI